MSPRYEVVRQTMRGLYIKSSEELKVAIENGSAKKYAPKGAGVQFTYVNKNDLEFSLDKAGILKLVTEVKLPQSVMTYTVAYVGGPNHLPSVEYNESPPGIPVRVGIEHYIEVATKLGGLLTAAQSRAT